MILRRKDLLTPEGTRDLLFEECAARRAVSERITGLFESYGYSEVVTPGLEFYDVFNSKGRYFPPETMYKLVDGKNRLMVLRPDSTIPIARLAATRLRGVDLPLKLFYSQNIFMVNPKDSGRDDEIAQSGIEILGGNSEAAEYEALMLAAKALLACDGDFRLEIGDSGIFRALMESYNCDEKAAENIRCAIENKELAALDRIFETPVCQEEEAFKALPRLFGGFEVFEEARRVLCGDAMERKLARLERLCRGLCLIVPEDKIRVDLGLVHKKDYYTGIIFRGYIEGYGQHVLSGGRYDTLPGDFGRDAAAVGFAVNVEAAARILLQKDRARFGKAPDVLVFGGKGAEIAALKHCDKLISDGMTVYNFLGECPKCAAKYAKAHNIRRVDIVSEDGAVTSEEV